MEITFSYSNSEKEQIREWKDSLPVNENRKFKYQFVENGKRDEEGYKMYDYYISTNLDESKRFAKDISL